MHRSVLFLVAVVAAFAVAHEENQHQKRVLATTWLSGASQTGAEVANGQFAAWRGEPTPIATTWSDNSIDAQINQWSMDMGFKDWTGDLDTAVGAIYAGESWQAASTGAYDDRWTQCAQTIYRKWLLKRTVYIRFAHEFNGDWFPWSVNSGNVEAFKVAWRRFHAIVQRELVNKGKNAKVVFGVNDGSKALPASTLWPGDAYVDVVSIDVYDWWPKRDSANWESTLLAKDGWGGPRGMEAWRLFAESHGKPLAFSEWGLDASQTVDNPFFIQKMNEWFRAHAGTGAGKVLYECYFNVWDTTRLYPTTNAPSSANMYKSLNWGQSDTTATPTTTKPATTAPPTPSPTTTKAATTVPSTTKAATTVPATTKAGTTAPPVHGAGWSSGNSGSNATAFALWRGEAAPIAGVFHDANADAQINQWELDGAYKSWTGDMDVSVGAIYSGETWAAASTGAYDARWIQALSTINNKWLSKKTLYLRFAQQMNGNWVSWAVTLSNVDAFKSAWKRFYGLVQSQLVAKGRSAKLVFAPNDGSSALPAATLWPGDAYVDVVGVSSHDGWPTRTSDNWASALNAVDSSGGPRGLEQWRLFAQLHGKPFACDWGLQSNVDNAFYIQAMNDWFRSNAGTSAGKLLYELYNNAEWSAPLYPVASYPASSAAYQSLSWGLQQSTSAPTTAAPTTQKPTTLAPTTQKPTTLAPTTQKPTSLAPTTAAASNAPASVTAVPIAENKATLSWSPPTSAGTVTNYRVGRDGFDSSGYGAWSDLVASTARSQTFLALLANTDYNLFVEALFADGTTGNRITVRIHTPSVVSTTLAPTTKTLTTAAPTTKAPTAAPTTAASTGGFVWLSGASGPTVADLGWAAWRGAPTPIATTWNDATAVGQVEQWSLYMEFGAWTGDLDAAVGAIYKPETWEQAATGAYEARWRQCLQKIYQQWLKKRTIYIRFAHEFNGNWFDWSVTPTNVEAFKASWRRFYNLVQQELVSKGKSAKLVWSANTESKAVPAEGMWPGDAYVDVVSIDTYDWWPKRTSSNWESSLLLTDQWGGPWGMEKWRQFALAHGKPLAISEWGLETDVASDNVFFIQKMNEWFRAHAGTGAGQLLYECYFNVWENTQLYPTTKVPNSANIYKSLNWGQPLLRAEASSSSSSSSSHPHTATIVAGVVVGAAVIATALAVVLAVVLLRRRKQQMSVAMYRLSQES